MKSIERRVVIWIFLYWIVCVNTLGSITNVLLFNAYFYQDLLFNTILALICATVQIGSHRINQKKALPFYAQFISIYFAFMFYFVVFEANHFSLKVYLEGLYTILMISFYPSIPLVLVAYFVRIRILKYDMRK